MSGKLTKAQIELLAECVDDEGGMIGVVQHYAPARILVSRGFARWRDDNPFSERLIITPSGREALKAAQ